MAKWVGRCPECGIWGTVDEAPVITVAGGRARRERVHNSVAVPISSIPPDTTRHNPTGVDELDRVLGGGVVPGSVTLLAGEPGVGKSTLLLKVVHHWARVGRRALYVSGEESAGQIRMRAGRTGCCHDQVYLAADHGYHRRLIDRAPGAALGAAAHPFGHDVPTLRTAVLDAWFSHAATVSGGSDRSQITSAQALRGLIQA